MIFAADYPFLEVILSLLVFVAWLAWFWMIVLVLGDVFGRDDLSGWSKAGWCVLTIFLPFVGVLSYVIVRGNDFGGDRRAQTASRQAAPAGGGAASEIEAAKRLLEAGTIDEVEFNQIKRTALA